MPGVFVPGLADLFDDGIAKHRIGPSQTVSARSAARRFRVGKFRTKGISMSEETYIVKEPTHVLCVVFFGRVVELRNVVNEVGLQMAQKLFRGFQSFDQL